MAVLGILIGTYTAANLTVIWRIFGHFGSFHSVMRFLSSGLAAIFLVDWLVAGALGIVLGIGAILTLLMKPLGRQILIIYAVAHVLVGVAGQIIIIGFVFPLQISAAPITRAATRPVGPQTSIVIPVNGIFSAALRLGWLAILVPCAAICLWSSVILIVMTRSNVKAAFEPERG
jgi:hypothetical protein